ncbi:MAG TPA: hypothetical protein VK960_08985 [Acidimicrobiia bacterium]|nr:hypothetical protein [Acidimicrobiia bacterium]
MRTRITAVTLALVTACGGNGEAGTTTSSDPGSTSAATTTPASSSTATPATTTTTLIQGPVEVLALTPYPLVMSSFGPTGVGPVPGSGLTMSLMALPSPAVAPDPTNAIGVGQQRAIGVFSASAGFRGDCLGFILWAEDFSARYTDGYATLTSSGCGDPGGPILEEDRVLLQTDRTLVLDLGPIPGGAFSPAFQVQNTAGDSGFYSVAQNGVVEPIAIPKPAGGLVLPYGGDLFEVSDAGVAAVPLPDAEPGTCEADENTVCLVDGRFRVRASFTQPADDPGGDPGRPGWSVPIGSVEDPSPDEAGYWFFDEGSVELLVKVTNGCTINGSIWVMFASFVEVDLRVDVTDTATGETRSYEPPSSAFPAVMDTTAFATCP